MGTYFLNKSLQVDQKLQIKARPLTCLKRSEIRTRSRSNKIYSRTSMARTSLHYENTPIQIYRKIHLQKTENFQIKTSDIFHISAQNIDCRYSLEPPRRGGSNEYHNICFEQK